MAYRERLLDRQSTTGRPVRVGLVGAGQMGRGFVAQVRRIAGMEVVAVADIDVQRATGALQVGRRRERDHRRRPRQAHQPGRRRRHRRGQRPAPADRAARRHGHRRHRRARDRRADRAAEPARRQARRPAQRRDRHHRRLAAVPRSPPSPARSTPCAGATSRPRRSSSSSSPATSPSTSSARARARTTRCDPHATPTSLTDEATSKQMNPKMLCSFVDGSKAMIEMAALANTAGLGVSKRGMNGHTTTVPDAARDVRPSADGGDPATAAAWSTTAPARSRRACSSSSAADEPDRASRRWTT